MMKGHSIYFFQKSYSNNGGCMVSQCFVLFFQTMHTEISSVHKHRLLRLRTHPMTDTS